MIIRILRALFFFQGCFGNLEEKVVRVECVFYRKLPRRWMWRVPTTEKFKRWRILTPGHRHTHSQKRERTCARQRIHQRTLTHTRANAHACAHAHAHTHILSAGQSKGGRVSYCAAAGIRIFYAFVSVCLQSKASILQVKFQHKRHNV